MLIRDIITESYQDDLLSAVQDLLAVVSSKDIKKISTEKFKNILAKQGFVASTDEIIQAVDMSGFASSVNNVEIIPGDELSGDVDTDSEPSVDVGKMAGNQALSDIKSEL
jgi:hypothetical protein